MGQLRDLKMFYENLYDWQKELNSIKSEVKVIPEKVFHKFIALIRKNRNIS